MYNVFNCQCTLLVFMGVCSGYYNIINTYVPN